MHRIAWLVFALCLAVATTFIVTTTGALPERVASHFGPGNAANGFMTRSGYLVFMLAFAVVLPVFVAAMIGAPAAGAFQFDQPPAQESTGSIRNATRKRSTRCRRMAHGSAA